MQAQELKNKFSLAIDLANQGKPELSIQLWDQISTTDIEDSQFLHKEAFLGEACLYRAWTLMDLEDYSKALNQLESIFQKSYLPLFTKQTLFDYYLSYGNAAGELAEKEKMENAFVEAMKLGKEENDNNKIRTCWLHLLFYTEQNKWWRYLEQAARTCIVFAESANDASLGLSAGLRRANALRNLGKAKRAEIQAKRIIQVAIQFQENEAIDKAQEFLNEMEIDNINGSN